MFIVLVEVVKPFTIKKLLWLNTVISVLHPGVVSSNFFTSKSAKALHNLFPSNGLLISICDIFNI